MIELTQILQDQIFDLGPSIFWVFLRIGACMALLPVFGEQVVSIRVRLAASVALTVLVWPLVEHLFPLNVSDAPNRRHYHWHVNLSRSGVWRGRWRGSTACNW